jgi:hypothetical protein
MPVNTAALLREAPPNTASDAVEVIVRPPTLSELPRRVPRRGLSVSTVLHGIALAAIVWLPPFFADSVVIVPEHVTKPEADEAAPLVLPQLPPLASRGSGSMQSSSQGPGAGAAHSRSPADLPLEEPDYVNPQQIVSFMPHPVNRVQTVLRPDLVRPPDMKFPMRLQSMVNLPAAAEPVLQTPPQEEVKQPPTPVVPAEEDIPVVKPAPTAVLTLTPKRASIVQAKAAPAREVSPNLKMLAKVQGNALKAVVVINAVNVEPDSAVALPDAQLAGLFVVGPSPDTGAAAKALMAGTSRSSGDTSVPSNNREGSGRPSTDNGSASNAGSDRASGAGGATLAAVSISSSPGNGGGSAAGAAGKPGSGTGNGSLPISGSASGSGAPGRGASSSSAGGISISGGVPARGSTAISKAIPLNHSYGLMVISGGSSGGASRDFGVFDRTETVYSVAISMSDAGGGPDWTMQYALLNRTQAGAGLLVPPFVEKKVGASVARSQFAAASVPIFIAGIIDENGKLQALHAVRIDDARFQPAMRALEQWQFLPAQLDGKPVASKVLIGATVTVVP